MAHLIVKDRKLCMVNGKYVTSANGAPCVCGGCLCSNLPNYARCFLGGTLRAFHRSLSEGTDSERELYLVFPHLDFSTLDVDANWFGPRPQLNCDLPVAGYGVVRYDDGRTSRFDAQTLVDVRPFWFTDPETGDCVLERTLMRIRGRITNELGQVSEDATMTVICYYEGNKKCPTGSHVLHGPGNGLIIDAFSLGFSITIVDPAPNPSSEAIQWWDSHLMVYTPSSVDDQVCAFENHFVAVKCDDEDQEITVALSDRGPIGTTPIYQGDRYRLTSQLSVPPVDTTQWDTGVCFPPPLVRHYARCDGGPELVYVDEMTRPDGMLTVVYQGDRYYPIDVWTNQEPTENIQWSDQDCVPVYAVYQQCDSTFTILVDETNKPPSALTATIASLRFFPTGEHAEGAPLPVQWSTQPCPNLESSVWERCRGVGSTLVPLRVRCDTPSVQGADYMYSVFVEDQPTADHPNCEIHRRIAYRKVEDDGGTYLQVIGSPNDGPCSNMPDTGQRLFCKPVEDAGDPQDPNNPAITDPGIKRTLPVQDLSGYDIEREIRAARQGGCCGSPTN